MAIKQAPDPPVTTTTGPRGGESRPRAWAITFTLVILYIINTSDKAVLGLVAQPLREEYGLTASQLGLVGSAFFLAFTISGFSAGLLARWAPLRWLLAFLALAWAACMVPVIAAASFAVLLVSRIVLGATEGPSSALIHTALYSWHPKEKRGLPGGAFITSGGGSIAKLAVLPAIALVVNQWGGWRAGFVTLAVGGVLWVVLWLLVWKEGPYGRDAASAASDSATGDHVPWKTIFTTPDLHCRRGLADRHVCPVHCRAHLAAVLLRGGPGLFPAQLRGGHVCPAEHRQPDHVAAVHVRR